MPDSTKPPESKLTEQALLDEVAKLRAQVKELQEELAQTETSAQSPDAPTETSEVLRNLPDRFISEASKTVRALTLACLEPLRVAGDIVEAFAEETRPGERTAERGRSRTRTGKQSRSETTSLPRDMYSGLVKAVDRSLDVPSKMVDRFYNTYKDVEKTGTR